MGVLKKHIGNILVVLKMRHTQNATVQTDFVWRKLAQFLKPFVSSQTSLCINFRKLLLLNVEIGASWQHSLQGIKPVKISRLCQLERIDYILCGCKCDLFTAAEDTVPTTGWKRSKEVEDRKIYSIGKVSEKYKRNQFLTTSHTYKHWFILERDVNAKHRTKSKLN